MKMIPEYAQKLLDGGYAFNSRFFSCHDDLLVVHNQSDDWLYRGVYYGTVLKDGQLQVNDEGFVIFGEVEAYIDENTRFSLP